MPDRPWNILLIGSDPGASARLETALLSGNTGYSAVVRGVTADRACDHIAEDAPELLFVDLDSLGEESIKVIARVCGCAPGVPLIAISRSSEETLAIEALQAGAQDCLGATEVDGLQLPRAVRYAIERSRFQRLQEEANQQVSRDRELGGLNVLSGPTPLPITERSLGTVPLVQRAPQEFGELVRRYGDLLDRSLMGRSKRETASLMEDLNDIADRLGVLGAGPRDAVELHKAAMTARLEECSARKNKGYVEEGRLLLVQLMGHLVSFYRSLSWGRGPALRVRTGTRIDALAAPDARGKTPQ
jgi:Response regulator containing a CheY-like receiver domain and a GGDEF domain